ncbi:hypothetical protein OAR97_05980 [Arcobacteraceae bacterium]|nr:hypothetical protein [Arcobacteraceae bacterium]
MLGVFDLFSKRRKKQRGEIPDVYIYDDIPQKLRVQLIHIIQHFTKEEHYDHGKFYEGIHKILCKEYGVFTLKQNEWDDDYNYEKIILEYILNTKDFEQILDILELFFKYFYDNNKKELTEEAFSEINARFKENGVGYILEAKQILRIDSQIIHSDIVKPTINILNESLYSGANEEFLKAHEHYRNNRNQECLNECLKSFESVLKAICDKNNWTYNQNDTANKLITICFENNLIPDYLKSQFTSLQSLFTSGVPTIRNRNSGHGQGVEQRNVTNEMTSYMLHLTATNILFLTKQEEQLNS